MEKIREQNEQMEIEKLFPRIYQKIDEIRNIFKELRPRYPEKLDNVAIFLNNKIVEIGQQYKDVDVGFYSEAKLKQTIILKLLSYYNYAYKAIKKIYDEIFQECHSLAEAYQVLEDKKSNLYIYDSYCDKIYNYNIKDNIVNDILEEYLSYPDKEQYLNRIEEYKNELITIGYEEQAKELNQAIEKYSKLFNKKNNIEER